jgi:hypothetical protein
MSTRSAVHILIPAPARATQPCACRAEVAFGRIGMGDTRRGTIATHDCVLGGYARAFGWQLDLEAAATLHFELASDAFEPKLVITRRSMAWVDGARNRRGHVATLLRQLPPGRYLVWAAAPLYAAGAYELRVRPG